MSFERPLASSLITSQADIIVGCYDNWRNLQDMIRLNTPGGLGLVEGVAFVRHELEAPDWRIIFNNPDWETDGIHITAPPNRTIFASGEPPTPVYFPWHDGQGRGTIVLTSDPNAANRPGNEHREYHTVVTPSRSWSIVRSYDFLKNVTVVEKPHRLSWVASDLRLLEGHRRRYDFLMRLKDEVDFDHFGRGFNEIHDKWTALAPYRYSIAYENAIADYQFSEKLNDIFLAQTMPIYVGSPIITKFFPPESLVIIDPEDPDVFRIIEDTAKSDLWFKRREAIDEAKRRVLDEINVFFRLARFVRWRGEQDEPDEPEVIRIRNIPLDYTMDETAHGAHEGETEPNEKHKIAPKKLHLGCGQKRIPGFYHVDIQDFDNLDRRASVEDMGFVEDGVVELIYASHVLEHFGRHTYLDVLREWHRKLKPGGILRLSVPDFEKTVQAYLDDTVPTNGIRGLLGALVGGQQNEFDVHRMNFDRDLLEASLREVGFSECRLWDWRDTEHSHIDDFSQAYIPKFDTQNGLGMSLNIEAIK